EYDLAGRLAQVAKNGSFISTYTYDSNGNRLTGPAVSTPAIYDDQDRLLVYRSATFTYTAAGELATKTDGGETTYVYDQLGNLLAVNGPSANIDYLTDATNRRVGKNLDGATRYRMLWDGEFQPIVQLDGADNVRNRFAYALHQNVPDYMVLDGS